MRKIITGTALVLTSVLLTGCGGGGTAGTAKPADPKPVATQSAGARQPAAGSAEVSHEVTLEVLGSGPSQVYYNLSTNKMEQVTLPWKKTETITLTTDAEKKVGTTVSVVPGSVKGEDGMLKAAPCVITVDGKKVADNQDGGASASMCRYHVK